jgi:hypothetical protein
LGLAAATDHGRDQASLLGAAGDRLFRRRCRWITGARLGLFRWVAGATGVEPSSGTESRSGRGASADRLSRARSGLPGRVLCPPRQPCGTRGPELPLRPAPRGSTRRMTASFGVESPATGRPSGPWTRPTQRGASSTRASTRRQGRRSAGTLRSGASSALIGCQPENRVAGRAL